MARKQAEPAGSSRSGGGGFFAIFVAVMAVVVAGAYYYVRRVPPSVVSAPASSASTPAASPAPANASADNAAVPDMDTPPDATTWPADLPPLPLDSVQATQPIGEVKVAYKFAAEHPEVLNYVPCFCGCEMDGHRSNEDCFVGSRDANGKVTGWDPHGMT